MSQRVVITEVGPRDGLQNEQRIVPLADKVDLVNQLAQIGFQEIEASAFVSPKWIPQLADAKELFSSITRQPSVQYSALVPNQQGLERAIAAKVDKIAVFTAASETFCQQNINTSIAGSIERFAPVIEAAGHAEIPVRGYVSCAVRCPYDGPTHPDQVRRVISALMDLGPIEIDLGDTIGAASPEDMEPLLSAVDGLCPRDRIVMHLHDTQGRAIEVARRCLELGVRRFDAAIAGLGGCPYAPGSPGNVATEAIAELCEEVGFEHGLDLVALEQTSCWVQDRMIKGRQS
ncbi:MAG: hydroxymethylglutaryl-CoA lyase [Phycisphaerales bacterium]|nr:hydroxymethylglutaryl-CoA lyase [Phycisphaerales bacterium]